MNPRVLFSILYGLHLVWTGLLRNIQAQAYKPNALWFCLILGIMVFLSAFLRQAGRQRPSLTLGAGATLLVFTFYLYSLIRDPSTDATYRVGLIILSSIAHLVILFLPKSPPPSP